MLSLALDTATPQGRFALAEDGRLLQYHPLNVSGSYADAILPMVDRLLAEAGRDLAAVGVLGVTVGPGSFTGVRIGVATAKTLAWALRCELVGVSTLAAMGAALLEDEPGRELAVPALDARRGEVFAALLRRRGTWVEVVDEAAARTPVVWWERLRDRLDDPAAPVWGGDGAGLVLGQGRRLRPELTARGEPSRRPWSAAHPRTAAVLAVELTRPGCALPRTDPFALRPSYLRASDAEVKRGLDLTPHGPQPPSAPGVQGGSPRDE